MPLAGPVLIGVTVNYLIAMPNEIYLTTAFIGAVFSAYIQLIIEAYRRLLCAVAQLGAVSS